MVHCPMCLVAGLQEPRCGASTTSVWQTLVVLSVVSYAAASTLHSPPGRYR
jgi:hypothetical protein